jgi:hypothetical protein
MLINRLLMSAMAVLLITLPVLAQEVKVDKARDAVGWTSVGVAFVLIVGVIVASFKGSKRGHLD